MILWFDPFWRLVSWNFMKLILKAGKLESCFARDLNIQIQSENDPSSCCCWGILWAYFLEEVKWAWVAWPPKNDVPEKNQGCTVKCYSLCEPKIPSWESPWHLAKVTRSNGSCCQIQEAAGVLWADLYSKWISFWEDEKKHVFFSIAVCLFENQ